MLEKEIKFIHDFSNNYVRELGLYFTVSELESKELHPALIRYISAEVDYRIFQDRRNLLKNSAFDYSGEKINQYFNLIKKEIKRSKRFSANQIDDLLFQAVEFNANFLMRPRKTLLTFFFGSIDILTTVEIKQLLNYLYYYRFLVKIIKSYFKEKNLITISRNEFEKLLEKIDTIGIETHLDELLETAVNSMTDFFNIGMLPKEKIPLTAIDEYLAEKNLNAHRKTLREAFHGDVKQTVLSKDVLKALKSVPQEKIESIGIIEDFEDEELVLEKVEEEPLPESNESKETALSEDTEIPVSEDMKIPEEEIKTDESSDLENVTEEIVGEMSEQEAPAEEKIEQTEKVADEEISETNETLTTGQDEPISAEDKSPEENTQESIEPEQQAIEEHFEEEKQQVSEEMEPRYDDVSGINETVDSETENMEIPPAEETEDEFLAIKEELEERKLELADFIDDEQQTEEETHEFSYDNESSVIDEIDSKIEELTDKSLDVETGIENELDISEPLSEETDKSLKNLTDIDSPERERELQLPKEAILHNEIEISEETSGSEIAAETETLSGIETVEENDDETEIIFSEFDEYFAKKVKNFPEDNIEVAINYAEELDYYVKPLDKEMLERFLEHSNVFDSDYMIEKINLAEFLTGESDVQVASDENLSLEKPEDEISGDQPFTEESEILTKEESFESESETVNTEKPDIEETTEEKEPEVTGEANTNQDADITDAPKEIPEELLEVQSTPGNGKHAETEAQTEQIMDEEVLNINEDSMLRKADEIDLDEFEKDSALFNNIMEYETEPTIKLADEFSRLELKPDIKMSIDDELIAGTAKEKQGRNAVKDFIMMNNVESDEKIAEKEIETEGEIESEEDTQETYTPPQTVQIDLESDEKLEIEDIIHSEYMPRIIEVVFDYDMIGAEELMNKLKGCTDKEECNKIIDEYCDENKINPSIPEVQVFKSLIARTVSA